eukprot:CAMPEP_0177310146 /NCGR_PEP_ID=MMETSP0368-20130122/9686_1 /TAXON_ID=447022 ORGANISM="Scrippsiella hangoei-like, Strain SHHI-4" /NCGR_SAMPLE_ID=MMETSP0368 /ASSEMBLY_ACC=CAM_ASM_000363 /LENGTH=52 /DNA_ID=CAMNT_0018769091 /DNA_START=27 /DNA_END=181 /DNA_ORIENTATION=+
MKKAVAMKNKVVVRAGSAAAAAKGITKKKVPVPKGVGRIRIGIIHGKVFDPV